MDELYEYIKDCLDNMYRSGDEVITVDMNHAFRLFHTICYMKQIREIIKFQDDMCDCGKNDERK